MIVGLDLSTKCFLFSPPKKEQQKERTHHCNLLRHSVADENFERAAPGGI